MSSGRGGKCVRQYAVYPSGRVAVVKGVYGLNWLTGREPGVWEEEGNGRTIEGCSSRLRVGVGGCVGWIEWRMGWGALACVGA